MQRVWVGAVVVGVTWQLILNFATYLISTRLQGASAVRVLRDRARPHGVDHVAITVFVVCAELDAVLVQRLYPRSLFSIYPDDPNTTPADRRAYASYAETERQKDYQNVDVSFDQPDPPDR